MPDFLIRKKNGKVLIIEVKMEKLRGHNVEGEKSLKALKIQEMQGLNPDKLKYEILFTDKDEIGFTNIQKLQGLLYILTIPVTQKLYSMSWTPHIFPLTRTAYAVILAL